MRGGESLLKTIQNSYFGIYAGRRRRRRRRGITRIWYRRLWTRTRYHDTYTTIGVLVIIVINVCDTYSLRVFWYFA